MPDVSVIMMTYNRRTILADTLRTLLGHLSPDDQVVLVDDGSTDGTEAMVGESFPSVDLLRVPDNEGYLPGKRCNQALAHCRHDMVWKLDSDCVPGPETVAILKGLFRRESLVAGAIRMTDQSGVVSGPDHPYRVNLVQTLAYQCPELYWRWQSTGILDFPVLSFGGNLCFSRDVATGIGGFDTDFDGNWGAEDAWFADKMICLGGVHLVYSLAAVVTHTWHSLEGKHRAPEGYQRNLQLWMKKSLEMHSQKLVAQVKR